VKGLERFIELCQREWPGEPIGVTVYPSLFGEYRIRVTVARWQPPGDFSERDLAQPDAIIRSIKMSMGGWMPIKA
jgi:hypothetical protein